MSKRKAYYKGLFKIEEVDIIAEEKAMIAFSCEPIFEYEYLIRFKSGKLKFVKRNKIFFREEMAA